jgi:RNA polymerase sigma-70 factor (ECF subfamily)
MNAANAALAWPMLDRPRRSRREVASMSASEERDPLSAAPLIQAIAQRGDRHAFAALFRTYAPKVKAFLLRRGAASADELTQEIMLTIWRKAATFDAARGSADAWIFAIARNAWIDAVRRERGKPLLATDIYESANPPRGDHVMEAAEAADRVRGALDALSAEQRDVVRLSFFDDRPHAEISAELGLPLGTVKSRLRLAMKRLRELLDDLA